MLKRWILIMSAVTAPSFASVGATTDIVACNIQKTTHAQLDEILTLKTQNAAATSSLLEKMDTLEEPEAQLARVSLLRSLTPKFYLRQNQQGREKIEVILESTSQMLADTHPQSKQLQNAMEVCLDRTAFLNLAVLVKTEEKQIRKHAADILKKTISDRNYCTLFSQIVSNNVSEFAVKNYLIILKHFVHTKAHKEALSNMEKLFPLLEERFHAFSEERRMMVALYDPIARSPFREISDGLPQNPACAQAIAKAKRLYR